MLTKLSKGFVAVAISSFVGLGLAWAQAQPAPAQPQQPSGPQWKDRAEYDLVQSIDKEADPKKKLDLLNSWKEKYPNSDFKIPRLLRFMATHQALNQPQQMYDTAKEILTEDPKNASAAFAVLLLTPTLGQNNPDVQATAEKVAHHVTTNVDEMKPAGVSDDAWKPLRQNLVLLAPRDLGWIALQKKNFEEAEKQLTASLKLNPNDAEGFAWLASAIYSQKKPERYSEALYFFARASALEGPGALQPAAKQPIEAYLVKLYTAYHGKDDAGLAKLKAEAKAQPFPPAGFHIPNETEVANQQDAELAKSNPSLAFWKKLKDALSEDNGQQYFDQGMKGALVPPEGAPPLKGKLVSAEPARNPKTLVLALSDPATPEVTVKLDAPLTGSAEPGTDISFRGIPNSFSKQPFMVIFDAEKSNVTGWPAPAPAKKAPVRKGAAKKK